MLIQSTGLPTETSVDLTAMELLLLRQSLADPGGMAVDSTLDVKLYRAQLRLPPYKTEAEQ